MAQQNANVTRQLVSPSVDFFVPHWQADVQVGGAYDLGEGKFSNLLSPALQLSATYQFCPELAVRGGLSGIWARNRYAYPLAKYQWNFVQPAVDLKADLSALVAGWNPERVFNLYAFLGGGVAYSFNNDDAVEADGRYGIMFQKLWSDNRWNPVVRGGLGADVRLDDNMAITFEANANMLPDHFNSKLGKNDNRDWHFNALVGLKFYLGKTHGRTENSYRTITTPVTYKETRDTVTMVAYIQFELNKYELRSSEMPKLERLATFLIQNPTAKVVLTGYADRETGTPVINQRLSEERARVVGEYLQRRGIDYLRITKYAKGDREQPFQIPEDNRVCICIVNDKVVVTRTK